MSEPVDPGGAPAPVAAPATAPRTTLQQIIETSVGGLKELLPAAALAVSVPLLITGTMPPGNEKVMLTVIGALAGFLTGRASKAAAK